MNITNLTALQTEIHRRIWTLTTGSDKKIWAILEAQESKLSNNHASMEVNGVVKWQPAWDEHVDHRINVEFLEAVTQQLLDNDQVSENIRYNCLLSLISSLSSTSGHASREDQLLYQTSPRLTVLSTPSQSSICRPC